MSENFLRVKRDILADMAGISHHTQESWAKIMLEHTAFLKTEEDQKSFWNFILNPNDDRKYNAPTFIAYNSEEVVIPEFQTIQIKDKDDEKFEEITLKNEEYRNGLTSYIKVTPVE
mgnify:FL=1